MNRFGYPACRTVALALTLAAPLLAGAGSHDVVIESMQFAPAVLTVQRGDTVLWRNRDLVPHTATAGGGFDSGNIAAGKTFAHTMDRPGRYDYVCRYHPGMKARVIVQ